MLTSYLLQASGHAGLQAQNPAGAWIDVAPVEGTLVVAVGQGLEALTGGVCASTTHRVLSPAAGKGARYSVPFFQGVAFDASFEPIDMPADVRAEREEVLRRSGGRRDDVEFTFVKGRWRCLGEATLMNRIKSHQDVGERWVRAETVVAPCHSPPIHPPIRTFLVAASSSSAPYLCISLRKKKAISHSLFCSRLRKCLRGGNRCFVSPVSSLASTLLIVQKTQEHLYKPPPPHFFWSS